MILLFSFGMLFLMVGLYQTGNADLGELLIATIAMMGSFGPVVALANLSNNRIRRGKRPSVFCSLLEEAPQVEETEGLEETEFLGAAAEHVNFSYEKEQILKDYSIEIPKGKVVGIHGPSGCGKSTLLRLFMRFWDVSDGKVNDFREKISGR